MTDQMIATLVQLQRTGEVLEIGMVVLMSITLIAGVVLTTQFLRRQVSSQRVTTVSCVAALLALLSGVALNRVRANYQLTIERAMTGDFLALWR